MRRDGYGAMGRIESNQLQLPLRFRQVEAIGRAHLALDGRLISYTIKRSARRGAISIMVDEEGLRVGAPWNATQAAIERLLHRHAAWILKKLGEWELRRAPARQWIEGELLMLLGEPFTLKLLADASMVRIQGTHLVVGTQAGMPVSRLVLDWLHAQALGCFEHRVEHYGRMLKVRIPHVRLSSARTRWGSCHSSGRIHLNWRLVQTPVRLIDYVVAHEVAHLLEMNHSQRFWRTVASLVPDYATRRKELRHEGHRYLLV